jgi:hypothetical protein
MWQNIFCCLAGIMIIVLLFYSSFMLEKARRILVVSEYRILTLFRIGARAYDDLPDIEDMVHDDIQFPTWWLKDRIADMRGK